MSLQLFPKYITGVTAYEDHEAAWASAGYEVSEKFHDSYSEVAINRGDTEVAAYMGYISEHGAGLDYERVFLAVGSEHEKKQTDAGVSDAPELPLEFHIDDERKYKDAWRDAGLRWREEWARGSYAITLMDSTRTVALALYDKEGSRMVASYIDPAYGSIVAKESGEGASFIDIIRGIA